VIVLLAGLGALGGAGLLLVLAPLLLPRRQRTAQTRWPWSARIEDRLGAAGFPRTGAALFVAVSVVLGLLAGSVVLAGTGVVAAAALAVLGGGLAPWWVAGVRAAARLRAARGLWPEVVDHLVASVRAGMPLPDAVASLATHAPAALRPGFVVFERRWRESGTVSGALDALKEHFADPTADRIVEILRMAREVGGTELPAVLRDLAAHLRQDLALRSEVEARQGWVLSAGKLGLAAPWIVLALLATRPEAAVAYTTSAGTVLVVSAAVVTVVAYRVMLAIGRLPREGRWFR
jgi:tight adherence protein B